MPALRCALREAAETAQRLSAVSRHKYQNPYAAVEWPDTLEPESTWFSSTEHLSLYGTPEWESMTESDRRRLSFHEAVNFYSLNIHGEKALMQGLAQRLYRRDLMDVTGYLHHFLDEENKHSIWFGSFCTKYAHVYRSRHVDFGINRASDVADLLFFGKTMIFEEIVDHLNLEQARDERLHPIARFINDNHHREETRHLVFGREVVSALWHHCSPNWDAETIADIRDELTQFFLASWHEYYNADVYTDMEFDDPWVVADRAWSSTVQRERRRTVSTKVLKYLRENNILIEEPADDF